MRKFFKNKKILITGHTGFKGSWLSLWLHSLGANIIGVSLYEPSKPSNYKLIKNKIKLNEYIIDIRDLNKVSHVIKKNKPDFVFHLAAQPIVSESFVSPINTFQTNIIGSANILECLKDFKHKCIVIMITSDKCYQNIETYRGYKEDDQLGGYDPYSASKSSAEIVIKSYFSSFLKEKKNLRLGIGRAGNVIGGGDWAKDRIVPDCIKSWRKNINVSIRNPNSTRPWQHVLEPLSGYLSLAIHLSSSNRLNGEAFNFGPSNDNVNSVKEVVIQMNKNLKQLKWSKQKEINKKIKESSLLKLNCEKAHKFLEWESSLNFSETIDFTIDWYKNYYEKKADMYNYGLFQIQKYRDKAKLRGIKWTKYK